MPRNTRNKNKYVHINHPMMQKRIRKLGNQQFMNKGLVSRRTQKEEPWREVAGKLSTWQGGISSLGKNDKGKRSQKLRLKKVRGREGRRTKSQLFRDTPEWKVSRRLLVKKYQKEKIMTNKEGTSHQCCWHNIGSSTQESKWGESVVPRDLRMTL